MNENNTGILCYVKPAGYGLQKVSGFHFGISVSVENGTTISEPLQLWQKSVKKVTPSFVTAISVSEECDIRDRRVKKKEV